MIGTLVMGTVIAVGALAYVLYPLFFTSARHVRAEHPVAPHVSEGDEAVAALREIEFDRETGKLSDADYVELKTRYTKQAIDAMRREGAAVAAAGDDEIELAVHAYRTRHAACPECGPRPEPDALYCSTCGRYLHDRCADCGAPVEALDARYCVNCGHRLAA